MVYELLPARNDPRFIPRRQAHSLCLIEFRILKRRDPDKTIQHRFRQADLRDENEVAVHKFDHIREGPLDRLGLP